MDRFIINNNNDLQALIDTPQFSYDITPQCIKDMRRELEKISVTVKRPCTAVIKTYKINIYTS